MPSQLKAFFGQRVIAEIIQWLREAGRYFRFEEAELIGIVLAAGFREEYGRSTKTYHYSDRQETFAHRHLHLLIYKNCVSLIIAGPEAAAAGLDIRFFLFAVQPFFNRRSGLFRCYPGFLFQQSRLENGLQLFDHFFFIG